jgi:Uncharacterized protein conserved in bacteria (DUF2188)
MNDLHVRFDSRHGWTVQRERETRPLSAHATQWGAERRGRTMAQRERGRLHIHDLDGRCIRSDCYGLEP